MCKRLLIVIVSLIMPILGKANSISGVVIDEQTKEALPGVYVTLINDSTKVLMGTITNGNGWFLLKNVNAIEVFVGLSYMGYESQKITVNIENGDLDLGEIKLSPKSTTLGEVVVTADKVVEKADKYVLIPSLAELNRASETLNLLSEMKAKMPGLQVNEALKKVSVDGGAVIFQVNGKEEPFSKVQSLNQHDILRVEYRNTPDIRYADRGVSGVINFIMKPRQEGGTIMVELDEVVTSLRSNVIISGTYYYRKSEWSVNYDNTWQKNTKQYSDVQEQYIGRENIVYRNQIGLPSSTRDFSNNVSLGYTYMYDLNTMLSARFAFRTNDINNCNFNLMEEIIGVDNNRYSKYNPNKIKSHSPTFDLYFRKNFSQTQSLELNATGTASSGDYLREMHYKYDQAADFNQLNFTNNDSWAAALEALYSIKIGNVTTRYGINYIRNHTENKYSENDVFLETDRLKRDNLYFYGDIAGRWNKLGYTLSVGGKYFHNTGMSGSEHYLKFKALGTLNYRINKHWSVNYLYMYSPEMPSLSAMNDDVHIIDDISLQKGNIYIKPSTYQRNRLYVRYNTGDFYATVWGSYSRTDNSLNSIWYYDSDPSSKYYQKFINQTENGNYTDNISTQLDLSYQNLFNHLTVSVSAGWDKYDISDKEERNSLNKIWASISANAYFGNWTVYANYALAPRYSLDGRTFCRDIRYDYFGAKYRWKDFSFGVRIVNAFTKRGFLQETETPSMVHPETKTFYIKDFANMIELNIVYRVSFGKSYQRANRTLQNKGIDTGVNVEY